MLVDQSIDNYKRTIEAERQRSRYLSEKQERMEQENDIIEKKKKETDFVMKKIEHSIELEATENAKRL